MDDQLLQEGENQTAIKNSFISRFNLDPDEKYSQENYLTCSMRFSIFESVLTKFLFQSNSSEFTLNPFLIKIAEDEDRKSLFLAYMKFFIDNYNGDCPLYFFYNICRELLRLIKEKNLNKLSFDKYILKLEFLLAWHFEKNFYPNASIFEHIESINDNIYLQNGLTNYIYSIQSLNTIDKFLSVFEKQSLYLRMEDDLSLINNLFCSEKVYYFYCDKIGKKKLPCGNLAKYLLQQLNTKISKNKSSKVNSCEIDNYIMMNLYILDKLIIQNHSFYLYKDPELVEIFNSLETYKTWPCPISNYCNRVLENIINENAFQGISVLNKLRQIYYIDLLDNNISTIDTKLFRYTLVISPKEWEKRHESDKTNCFNILKFLDYLQTKPKNKRNQILVLKEMLIKILITIICNSDLTFNHSTIKKLYQQYMPNYQNIYTDNKNAEDKIKPSLDKLLKIIDVGFDKPLADFNEEINLIAKKITGGDTKKTNAPNFEESIFKNKFFLPVNSMRNYFRPNYLEFKKLFKDDNNNKEDCTIVNIFDTYITVFKEVVNSYFKFLLTDSSDPVTLKNLKIMRRNFYETFRINILLIEEENSINDFIENLQNKIFNVLETKISDSDFEHFWKYFVFSKKDVVPKYLLHVIPNYERSTSNPFRILTEENTLANVETYLSEYIANNDYIYKNMIFLPFSSTCDNFINNLINKSPEESSDLLTTPTLKSIYSFLKKSLDAYFGESQGIFNLDLYQVTINDNAIKKVFWKNIELLDVINESYKQTKLTMTCVDLLGIEYKTTKEITLNNNFDIKIFNLFYKKNVPFNYNITSNNGWLELFLDDKYDIAEVNKFCNFQSFLELNKTTKFYEEFNLPQTDSETRFKNYKIKSLLIESNSPTIIIRCDDYMDISYEGKVDLSNAAKAPNELKLKIKIEPFKVQGDRYSIPIATFTTI